jgi:predicted histidine transporter YuiF (NhaC family)
MLTLISILSCWEVLSVARIDPVVRKETAFVALWVAVAILPVQMVFWALGRWDYTVLLGSLLGSITAVGNLLMIGLMVQKAVSQTEKQAKNTVRLSQGGRLLLQGVILVVAAALPKVFNVWAAAIPLLVPRIALSLRELVLAKRNPSPDRPAIGWDDDEDLMEQEDD